MALRSRRRARWSTTFAAPAEIPRASATSAGEYPRSVTSASTVASRAERPAMQPRTRCTSPCSSTTTSGSAPGSAGSGAPSSSSRRGRGCIRVWSIARLRAMASTQERKYSGSRNAGSASIVRANTSCVRSAAVSRSRTVAAMTRCTAPACRRYNTAKASVSPATVCATRLASGSSPLYTKASLSVQSPSAKGEINFADGWL